LSNTTYDVAANEIVARYVKVQPNPNCQWKMEDPTHIHMVEVYKKQNPYLWDTVENDDEDGVGKGLYRNDWWELIGWFTEYTDRCHGYFILGGDFLASEYLTLQKKYIFVFLKVLVYF